MFKILVILSLAVVTRSLPQGAPATVCETMLPFHGGGLAAQAGLSPFVIEPSVTRLGQGSRLRIRLYSKQGVQFGGFMLHARNITNGKPIGTFVQIPERDAKLLQCSGPGDTVTHTNPQKKGPLEFYWEPPTEFLGDINFK